MTFQRDREAYMEGELALTPKGGVFQGFYNGHIRIFQIRVLSDQCDRNAIEETLLAERDGHEFVTRLCVETYSVVIVFHRLCNNVPR